VSFFQHREGELYRFGLEIGWCNLRAGGLRRLGVQKTLGKLLQPILSPQRFGEYDAVLRHLPRSGRMLDVGSPKLFDLWLASRYPVEIVATDVWPPPVAEYLPAWSMRAQRRAPPGKVRFVATDGTATCFRDGAFPSIFAISVIEHIEGDGDRRFLDEAARLLTAAGRLLVTVPWGPRYEEQYTAGPVYGASAGSGPAFFQRVYDRPAAERRLMSHPLLRVAAVFTVALPRPALHDGWSRLPARLRGATGFLNPLWSGLSPRPVHTGFAEPSSPVETRRPPAVEGDLLILYERSAG